MYFAHCVNINNINLNTAIHITVRCKHKVITDQRKTAIYCQPSAKIGTNGCFWNQSSSFWKKYVPHTSRRTVMDSDLSVKARFQFIWELYSIIQQALDSQLDRLKATSVCFNHQLKVTHFCWCTNSDKTAGSHTALAAQPTISQVMKIRVLFCWFDSIIESFGINPPFIHSFFTQLYNASSLHENQ